MQHYWGRGGLERDVPAARDGFRDIIGMGNNARDVHRAEALYNLGVFHANGEGGLNPDEWKAYSLWNESASLDYSPAQNALGSWEMRSHKLPGNLGDLNGGKTKGGHTSPNMTKAINWFELSASNGNSAAKFQLATLNLNGRGMAKNFTRAAELLAQAAALGDVRSSHELAAALTDPKSWLSALGRFQDQNKTKEEIDSLSQPTAISAPNNARIRRQQ